MSPLLVSRLQFAFTMGYHILWPAFTIGLAWFIVFLGIAWFRTKDPVYQRLQRFWIKVFALAFGMGVVTGVVISYQLGLNWSTYARVTADVIGPLFVLEVLTAFFLEAGFVGIMLFGQGRVSAGVHFASCVTVATGTVLSAFWIISANSWMQTPTAYKVMADGHIVATSFWGVVFNPSMPYRLAHMLTASFVTGSFVVAGVSSFWLWRAKSEDVAAARASLSLSLWLALVLVPLQIMIGDQHGLNTREFQPMKLAAIEGRWETMARAPLNLFALPDQKAQLNHFELGVPLAGSLILTHSLNGEIKGLKEVAPSEQPPVAIVFFAFRIMVGCGVAMLGLALAGGYLRLRGRLYDTRWFQFACIVGVPLGFIATLAGWTVTEVGRQPYVVYGLLRTSDAVSPIAGGAVVGSLALAVVLYNLLLLGFFWYGGRLVLRGPADDRKATIPVGRPIGGIGLAQSDLTGQKEK
jgi:cytochrome bd ubiquinol oxidase subunit I